MQGNMVYEKNIRTFIIFFLYYYLVNHPTADLSLSSCKQPLSSDYRGVMSQNSFGVIPSLEGLVQARLISTGRVDEAFNTIR